MIISIEIPAPPKECGKPERGPVYLSLGDIVVLIGSTWMRAKDIIKIGGGSWIFATKSARMT